MANSRYVNEALRSIRVTLAGAFIAVLSACAVAFEPGALSGRVSYEDGKPAGGAYVIGMWTGADPIAGSHSCYRAIVAQTDAQGRYRIVVQGKSPNVVDVDTGAVAFMPGHMAAKANEDANGLLIGPLVTDKKAYFRYLTFVAGDLSCGLGNWQSSNMSPLAHLLTDEMTLSATSPDDRAIAEKLADGLIGGR